MAKEANNRKPFNWEVFDAMVQFKVTADFCADYMGVSRDTVERRLREKYDMTFRQYNDLKIQRTGFKLQQKAIELALKGNVSMMIFALKNIANWSDKQEAVQSGNISITIDDDDAEL